MPGEMPWGDGDTWSPTPVLLWGPREQPHVAAGTGETQAAPPNQKQSVNLWGGRTNPGSQGRSARKLRTTRQRRQTPS